MKQPRTFFIADLHLQATDKPNTKLFLKFLEHHAKKAEALYILGDLFVVWAGDDEPNELSSLVKNSLSKLSSSGTKVFLMPGNRDFLLGEQFAAEAHCTLLHDPTVIDLYGVKTLITHGDAFYGDGIHKGFRKFTRDKRRQKIFFKLPFLLRKSMALATHAISQVRNLMLSSENLKNKAEIGAIKIMHHYAVSQVIHGHLHTPFIEDLSTTEDFSDKVFRQMALGDWQDKPSILVYQHDGFAKLCDSFEFQ